MRQFRTPDDATHQMVREPAADGSGLWMVRYGQCRADGKWMHYPGDWFDDAAAAEGFMDRFFERLGATR